MNNDLLAWLDALTPQAKQALSGVPAQQHLVLHALAVSPTPRTAREVGAAVRLSSSMVSAQIDALQRRGLAAEEPGSPRRRRRYTVADPALHAWCLARWTRGTAPKVLAAVAGSSVFATTIPSLAARDAAPRAPR